MTKPPRQTTLLWLMAIVAAAACLRFATLEETGIFGVDDGRYVLDSMSKYNEIQFCAGLVRGKLEELRGGPEFVLHDAVEQGSGALARLRPFFPKLGFSYLTALVMLIAGLRVTAVLWVEAIAGVLMVWAVFALVRAIHNDRAGLVAAAMLAFSNYHIYFSTNAYPQCSAALLLLAAVMCHLHWQRGASKEGVTPLLASGAFAGLSFWVNYQAAGALPLLAVAHAVVCLRGGSIAHRCRRFLAGALIMAAGFAAVILCAEALTYPFIFLFRGQGMAYPHSTFLELLSPRFTAHAGVEGGLSGLLLFPFFFHRLEGAGRLAATAALSIAGLVLLVRKIRADRSWLRSPQAYRYAAYLLVPCAVPFLFFSLKSLQGARTFTFVLPFLFGMLAIAAETAWRIWGGRSRALRYGAAALLAITAAAGAMQTVEILGTKSAYPEVIRFLEQHKASGARTVYSATLHAYLLEAGLDADTPERADADYFLTDWQELYDRRYPDESLYIPPASEAVELFQHQFGRIFLEIEAFPAHGTALESIRWVRGLDLERARRIPVYRSTP